MNLVSMVIITTESSLGCGVDGIQLVNVSVFVQNLCADLHNHSKEAGHASSNHHMKAMNFVKVH